MLIFDFFAGTGSATQAFEDNGHKVIKIELDEQFQAHERDILSMSAQYLLTKYGRPDFIWASPPCTSFSVASIGKYWNKDLTAKTDKAEYGLMLVDETRKLIEDIAPKYGWIIENPRGMLRKLRLQDLPRRTVTYCQYGDTRMKPTDLWGYVKGWQPKPPCKNGDICHTAAPRGSRTGTQGLKGTKVRSMIPYALSEEIMKAVTNVDN